jgi:hypothetical protein
MLFGRKNDFAIEIGEVLPEGYNGPSCQFRFWIGGRPIGDWDDRISLLTSVHWMQLLIDQRPFRTAESTADESTEAVFMAVYDAFFDADPFNPGPAEHYRDRHHLDDIGLGAISDKFGLVVVELPSREQRVVVKDFRAEMIAADVRLPEATVEEVGQQYIRWARSNWIDQQ